MNTAKWTGGWLLRTWKDWSNWISCKLRRCKTSKKRTSKKKTAAVLLSERQKSNWSRSCGTRASTCTRSWTVTIAVHTWVLRRHIACTGLLESWNGRATTRCGMLLWVWPAFTWKTAFPESFLRIWPTITGLIWCSSILRAMRRRKRVKFFSKKATIFH